MNKINKSLAPNIRIYFDTVDTRLIYYIMEILKNKNLRFTILDKEGLKDIDVTITDKEKYGKAVLQVKEITYNPASDFVKIASKMFGEKKDSLCIGIDPGKRTGIAAFFGTKLVLNEVISPWEDAVLYIVEVLKEIGFNRKLVKIGAGNLNAAEELKKVLQLRFDNLEIYFVNEQRTTKTAKKKGNRGREKDKISAVEIARKNGKRVV